jgi:hypothetical protein
LHARLATDATVSVEINYRVVSAEKRRYGANGYTRRVVAMITPEHGKKSPRVGILSLFDILNPGAKAAQRDFIFRFACNCAGVTADAFAVVNYEAISHIFLKDEG